MCLIKGDRIKIRKLEIEDVFNMSKWESYKNPLFFDYNFPELNREDMERWFKVKTGKRDKECYGILNHHNNTMGYLTIKDIKRFRKHATLGIVFSARYVNMNYGTEAIKLFLDYYFNKLNMKVMYLNVAKFNKRAIRCYEKCGFVKVDEYVEKFDNQNIDIQNNDIYISNKGDFIIENNLLYIKYNVMRKIK